jgi:hypothetical protein
MKNLGARQEHDRPARLSIRRLIAPADTASGYGELGLPGHVLHCPECRSDYVGWDGVPAIEMSDDNSAWEGRGSVLTIPMQGECGHNFVISLGFHKGRTWLFVSCETAA